MNIKVWIVVLIGILTASCDQLVTATPKPVQPEGLKLVKKTDDLNVWEHDGRLYVIGDMKVNESFKKNKHLPYTKTLLGHGPMGETVIFEVNKKDDTYADGLIEKYAKIPFQLEKSDNYFVWKYDGRIYVIGNAETNEKFMKSPHLPYTKTLLGAGPQGETVIFEVDKKDDKFADNLIAKYKKM